MLKNAIARTPGRDFAQGITTSGLGAPDITFARSQHEKYIQTLMSLGLKVEVLPPLEGCPDAVFVEDTALVVPEAAVITHPGAKSRQGETATIGEALKKYKPVEYITASGATIDGGDVMLIDHTFYVGMSGRTNKAGMDALISALAPYGSYEAVAVPVPCGLHLKSFVTQITSDTIIVSEELYGHPAFARYNKVKINKKDEYSINTIMINGKLLMAEGYPETERLVREVGCEPVLLNMSEYRKMDGALTCLSLRF